MPTDNHESYHNLYYDINLDHNHNYKLNRPTTHHNKALYPQIFSGHSSLNNSQIFFGHSNSSHMATNPLYSRTK